MRHALDSLTYLVREPRSGDREAKFAKVFESAKLDGAKMVSLNHRGVETAIRNATQGEAWVDDLQKVLKGLMDVAAAEEECYK